MDGVAGGANSQAGDRQTAAAIRGRRGFAGGGLVLLVGSSGAHTASRTLTDLNSEHEGTYYSCSTTVRLQKMYEHCVHFPDSLQRRLVEPYLVELAARSTTVRNLP